MKRKSSIILIMIFLISMQCGIFESKNHPPKIVSINATPLELSYGEYSRLSIVATDEDNDKLTYTWSSEHGYLDGVSGTSVVWHPPGPPSVPGKYTIQCIVSDGKDTVKGSVSINIIS